MTYLKTKILAVIDEIIYMDDFLRKVYVYVIQVLKSQNLIVQQHTVTNQISKNPTSLQCNV